MGDDDASNLAFDETSQPMDVDDPGLVINPEDECFCQSESCRDFSLSHQLDTILDPGLIFSTPNQPERVWTILAHGHQDSADYIEKLNEYRVESHCGLAWPPGYVAYRCRTCSVALTMSLCAECFRAGKHEGHDYNMFKSRSGGACDCGYDTMKSTGHCSNHGRNAKAPRSHEAVPKNLTCPASRAIPRMMSRLVIQLRRQAVCQTMETDIYLDCLTNIANSSAILRNLMIQVILSESAYSSQTQLLSHHPDSRISKIVRESQKILKRERKKLVAFRIPPTWAAPTTNINAFCDKPPHKTFLEELVFWMVVYEFHQKLVCFLLGFLMDDSYKEVFSRLFVNYYPNIAVCLTNSPSDPRRPMQDSFEHLSRRLLQVSVQIYNDDELTRTICDEEMTLHALIYCLRVVIEGSQPDGIFSALKPNPLCQHNTNAPKVVCCDTPILRDRQLTSFTEDLLAILSFEHQTKRLLSDKNLLQVWLEMLSYFQTMSPYKRELNEHAPYENGPRQSVFMIESEFCLVPLWTMLEHLKDTESIAHTSQLLESIHANLASWLYRMSIGPHSKLDTYFMSFHIPLHRMLAATIRHLIYEQGVPEGRIFDLLSQNQSIFGSKFSYKSAHGARVTIKIDDFFQMLILHPLQALTLYHQTRSGMWTRNGILTVNQAITYVHCAYCYSIIDMDMFLLRYCASRLKADIFLKSFLQKFYAWHCLSFTCGPIFSDTPSDTLKVHYYFNIQPEQITQMVESCLITLIQLLTLSNHCNISSRDQTKQEMISLISVADRSYSYLVDMIPSISEQQKDDEVFLSLLDELTVYKPASHGAGGNLHQGCYTLKPEIWENDYDPVHILYRYYHRRDHQQSLDRFFQHAKSTGKLNRRSHSSALWPPLKIPKKVADFNPIDLSPLVRCQTLLGVIFSILYKCIYVEEMPDSMMAYTIHLLELSLRSQLEISSIGEDMDRDPDALKNDAVRFTKSTSFVGRYSYRELISYYENMPKDEALLKGRTIYSLFTEEPSGPDPHENVKLFPFVKHALDLAFDTTWFPFDSVIDNCLVHIETVHSLPRDEFDAMIQCANNDRTENESIYDECLYATTNSDRTSEQNLPDMSTTSSTRSTESQTATWSNLVGLEVEEIDDIEVIEVDDEEEDELEVDDILNSDDLNERIDDVDETSEIELSMVNQPDANEAPQGVSSPSASVSLTNSVTTTPTLSFERYTGNAQVDARQATTNPETEPSPVRERDLQGYIRMGDYRDAVRRLEAQRGVTSDNFASAIIHLDRMSHASGQSASSSISSVTRNSTTQQLHTSQTASAQQSRDGSSRHIGEISPRPEQPSQQIVHAQNLITERRAILDAQPRPMITNPPQPLALEAASSAPSLSTEMSTNTASTSTTNQDLQAQSMPQNGSNPTSQIATRFSTNVSQALEELTANLTESTGRHHHHASNQRERSLTEIDIHARFIGFFHSDTTSSSRTNPSRLMPRRQTARRGNYRGAYLIEPYLPYMNPNNTNTTTNNNNNNNNATANNNNNNNNSYNNNNSETVQELVRRSAAVIPAITNAVRSTIQQTVQRVENLETAQSSMTAHSSVTERARNERADESSPSSSPSPPLSSRAAGRAIVTPRRQVPIRSSSGWTGQQVPASFHMVNRFNASRSHQQQIQQDQRSRRLRKEHRQHHGESIMTLLLRLHAKYSQRPRSYHYDECRAQTNLDPSKRCKIGDGTHFVTIVLDLICTSDVKIRQRVDYLMELIWPKPANEKIGEKGWLGVGCLIGNEKDLGGETSLASCDDIELDTNTSKACRSSCASTGARTMPVGTPLASTSHSHMSASMKSNANSMDSMALLTPEEKRHRAKERQTRLMAEFANKQRAFMEKYAASTSSGSTSNATRSGSHSSTSTSTTSTMAHAQGVVTANSSNLALRIDGRETPNAHVRYEEQPINLSSKSNQEHARLSQSTPIAANNGPKTDCKPLSDAHDSDHKYGAQSITPNVNSSFVTQDTRKDEGSDSSSLAAGSGKQQPSSSHEERVQLQTSRANSAFDPANDALRDASLYECCICGVEGLSDSTNPLGQVVLLQSTSVHGHSHLRSRDERKLPCDESSHLSLKEETYAKYLERRIDVLCEHFKESSWLDAINIGAEGGVHVQSCGHHLHIDCHQSYIRSLDQEDGLRGRNDSDEFQCPVCRQLANSVLPILNDDFFLDTKRLKTTRPFSPTSKSTQTSTGLSTTEVGDNPLAKPSDDFTTGQSSPFQSKPPVSSSLTPRESMDDQIAQIGLQLRTRQAPNQQELQSSAIFCAHLTKATGPQYRLVRTTASMHSLFLFLSSIARTNLETSLIARSIKPQVQHERAALNRTDQQAGVFKLEDQRTQHCSTDSGFQPAMKRDKGKRSCFQLLFHVLALNAQTLISSQWCTYDHIWSHLTHSVPETNRLSIRPRDSEVPLLLRDPVAMLLQFLFTVIGSKSHELAHFTCLVRILLNLTVIQSTALVLSYVRSVPQLRPDESHSKSSAESFEGARVDQSAEISRDHALKRNKQQDEFDENDQRFLGLEKLLWAVLTNLGPLLARGRDEPLMNSVVRNSWPRLAGQLEQDIWRVGEPNQQDGQRQFDEHENRSAKLEFIENKIKLACLPFLRAAAFLHEHLYGGPGVSLLCELDEDRLSDPPSVDYDFSQLVQCLELAPPESLFVQHRSRQAKACKERLKVEEGAELEASIKYQTFEPITLHQTLNWPSSAGPTGQNLVASWAAELIEFARERSIAARTLLLSRPLAWYRPALMQLPHAFDDIFMFYYRRKCSLCQQVPKDVAVCLVCGAPICFRASCCKDRSRSRQVHSQHCGANTAVFLAVHTSAVVVIRGNRACVWGSVYLDAHDEEDNGLQRGKPLYMVPARFALLETQWLTHSFDHTCGKRWIYLQEAQ